MKRNRGRKVMCQCGRTTQSFDGVCAACKRTAKKADRPCEHCDNGIALARSTFCGPCRRDLTRLTPEDVLTDGRWVQRGLTQVWVPTPPAEPIQYLRASPGVPWVHGTERGYQRHRRHRDNWPLPTDDPCGCRAAHRAHEAFRVAMRDERPERKAS